MSANKGAFQYGQGDTEFGVSVRANRDDRYIWPCDELLSHSLRGNLPTLNTSLPYLCTDTKWP